MIQPPADARFRAAAAASGFTLIEVLAALVIVSLGMLGVIEAVTQEARNGTYLREKTLAHWIAMNVVTEQRLNAAPPPVAESSDDVEFAGRRWHWTMKVSQTQVQSLRRMDVTVRPAESREDVTLATVTGFYGSAVGPAGGSAIQWNGPPGGTQGQNDEETGAEPGKGKGKGKQPGQPPAGTNPPTMPPQEED
jgi:general secretion pathway protein I